MEEKRFQLFEPEKRAYQAPEASLRFIENRFGFEPPGCKKIYSPHPTGAAELFAILKRDWKTWEKIVYALLKEQEALTVNSETGFKTRIRYCDHMLIKE